MSEMSDIIIGMMTMYAIGFGIGVWYGYYFARQNKLHQEEK